MATQITPSNQGNLQNPSPPLQFVYERPDQNTWMKTFDEFIWIKDYYVNWSELEKASHQAKLRLTFLKNEISFPVSVAYVTAKTVMPWAFFRNFFNV